MSTSFGTQRIVVGAHCAGSAAGFELTRAGRRVVALYRVAFPADTISTHLIWPGGVGSVVVFWRARS